MKYAICHTKLVNKKGEMELRIEGKLYLVREVSFEECPSCGERVLSPEVSQILYEKIKNKKYVEQTIKIPVLEGTFG
jgi:YgiT-type zinc finger domain-containing protein